MDISHTTYRSRRVAHWNGIAQLPANARRWSSYYHRRLVETYKSVVSAGDRVIELGCGTGDLLAGLAPAFGVGVDFSQSMLDIASHRNPELHFVLADAHDVHLVSKFDVIIVSDLLNDVWDVQTVFQNIQYLAHARTRLIINSYSHLWELPLRAAEKMGLAHPTLHQNWLTVEDIINLLYLSNFEVIRRWQEVLWPLATPGIATIFNRFLVRCWPFTYGALSNFVIARPRPAAKVDQEQPSVSIVIPARNEAGNIVDIMARTPQMGSATEMIFVEGHSNDNTFRTIEQAMDHHPELNCSLFRQSGKGKGDAVRLGFEKASGDILMILDADLTMPPEDLPRYYELLCNNKAEFVNGVRLVYPMEAEAMRYANLVANKFFSLAFSWLLGQHLKDTLCGTKALWRVDYKRIAANRTYFGDFDPFGDFDLLFGAARLNLKNCRFAGSVTGSVHTVRQTSSDGSMAGFY